MLNEATIVRGAFWSLVGSIFERITFFILPVFIAPLGAANLGIFYISLRVFHMIVSFPTTALNIGHTHRLRQYLGSPKSLLFEEEAAFLLKVHFVAGLVIGILLFILILIFSPVKSVAFLALAIPFAMVNQYTVRLLSLLQRFKRVFIIQAAFVFGFQLVFLIIFIGLFRYGIAAAFLGQLLVAILISISAFFFIFDRLNLLAFFNRINIKETFALSKLSFANVIFITLSPILDIALVGILFGFSALGHYVVLLFLPLVMHRIPTGLFDMFVHVARVKAHKGQDITQISKQVFKWILILTVPIFIVILLYPEFILSSIFHKTYVKDLDVTRLLAAALFLQSISWTAERILIAKNKKVQRVASNYIFASVFVMLSLFFALGPRSSAEPNEVGFGLFGIAAALLIASLLDALIKYILVIKKTKISFIGTDHMKILSVAAVSGFAAHVFFSNNPLLSLIFFLVLYFAILLLTGSLSLRGDPAKRGDAAIPLLKEIASQAKPDRNDT